ncbi:rod shape-determining protein MreC [Acetobacteraceae bacterium]|nr:rod shape-determining protein MreC [Candidatus Parcubacteria bacterium]
MKTISRSHWRKRPPYANIAVVFVVVIVFGCLALWREKFAGVLWTVGEPILKTRMAAGNAFSGVSAQLYSKSALVKENEALKAALASSTAALLDRDLLVKENTDLRRHTGSAAEIMAGATLASVIMRPPAVPYDTFVIDVGTDAGVREGDLVAAAGSALIGVVSQVYGSTARVVLFSSPGMSYPATLRTKNGKEGDIPLTMVGQGAGSMRAEVPAGSPVSMGDFVILQSTTLTLTGIVSDVERSPSSSFQVLYFHLPINLFQLQFVEVRHIPQV